MSRLFTHHFPLITHHWPGDRRESRAADRRFHFCFAGNSPADWAGRRGAASSRLLLVRRPDAGLLESRAGFSGQRRVQRRRRLRVDLFRLFPRLGNRSFLRSRRHHSLCHFPPPSLRPLSARLRLFLPHLSVHRAHASPSPAPPPPPPARATPPLAAPA